MQNTNQQDELKRLKRQLLKIQLAEAPGTILLALGLYATFATDGDTFLPFMDSPTVVAVMLGVGIVSVVIGTYKSIVVAAQIRKLESGK